MLVSCVEVMAPSASSPGRMKVMASLLATLVLLSRSTQQVSTITQP